MWGVSGGRAYSRGCIQGFGNRGREPPSPAELFLFVQHTGQVESSGESSQYVRELTHTRVPTLHTQGCGAGASPRGREKGADAPGLAEPRGAPRVRDSWQDPSSGSIPPRGCPCPLGLPAPAAAGPALRLRGADGLRRAPGRCSALRASTRGGKCPELLAEDWWSECLHPQAQAPRVGVQSGVGSGRLESRAAFSLLARVPSPADVHCGTAVPSLHPPSATSTRGSLFCRPPASPRPGAPSPHMPAAHGLFHPGLGVCCARGLIPAALQPLPSRREERAPPPSLGLGAHSEVVWWSYPPKAEITPS